MQLAQLAQNRAALQPIPPTSQRVTSSTLDSPDSDMDGLGPSSSCLDDYNTENGHGFELLKEIQISTEELCVIETKELNKLLKKFNISKQKATDIKQLRRTLKNRGYASTCRDKRMQEEEDLKGEIWQLEKEINSIDASIRHYESKHDMLKEEYLKMEADMEDAMKYYDAKQVNIKTEIKEDDESC